MADRLVKRARLARSGVYQYAAREMADLGLPLPPPNEIGDKAVYSVYRPAMVLSRAVKDGMFVRLPVTRGHPHEWVDPNNFREYTVGYTGDSASIEYLSDVDEVSVTSSLTLGDAEAMDAYESGVKELSPGYRAAFVWSKGEIGGRSYDAVMTGVIDTNHLALVDKGRGGAVAAILDHRGADMGMVKKVASALWYRARKVAGKVNDQLPASQASGFTPTLMSLVEHREKKSDDDITSGVQKARNLAIAFPDSQEKALLLRYMDDMPLMKEERDDVVLEAVKIASALYDSLDKMTLGKAGDGASKDCGHCGGSGKMKDGVVCPECKGEGKIGDETVSVSGAPKEEEVKEVPDKPKVGDDGEPAQPPAAAPEGQPAAAPAQGQSDEYWMEQLATLIEKMMADRKARGAGAPAAAPAAGAAEEAKPGAEGEKEPEAPGEKEPETPGEKEPEAGPPKEEKKPTGDAASDPPTVETVKKPDGSDGPGESKDEMPSLTALVSDRKATVDGELTLDGILAGISSGRR